MRSAGVSRWQRLLRFPGALRPRLVPSVGRNAEGSVMGGTQCRPFAKAALQASGGSVLWSITFDLLRTTCLPNWRSPDTAGGPGSGSSQQGRRWAGRIGLTAEERSPTPESGSMTMQRCVHACASGAGRVSAAACCDACPYACARTTPAPITCRRRGSFPMLTRLQRT